MNIKISKNELRLIISGLEWKLDQTNDESERGPPYGNKDWLNTAKLQTKLKGLK